jgi:uncharacterized protein YciI
VLYAWIGFLRPDVDRIAASVQQLTTDFLGQPSIEIRAAGPLRDAHGKRTAMMMIFDRDDRKAAEDFVQNSPYLQAGLYQDHRLYEFANEVG